MKSSAFDVRLMFASGASGAGGLATIVAMQLVACPALDLAAGDINNLRALLHAVCMLFAAAFVHSILGNALACGIEKLAAQLVAKRAPLTE